jgi:hypothetical protein
MKPRMRRNFDRRSISPGSYGIRFGRYGGTKVDQVRRYETKKDLLYASGDELNLQRRIELKQNTQTETRREWSELNRQSKHQTFVKMNRTNNRNAKSRRVSLMATNHITTNMPISDFRKNSTINLSSRIRNPEMGSRRKGIITRT